MGIFNFAKQKKNSEDDTKWLFLENSSQLESIEEASKNKLQLIFKHSTRCAISSMVLNKFKQLVINHSNHYDLYYLDLLKHREISNQIANTFNVLHESPQVIIIKSGVVLAHASHSDILYMSLEDVQKKTSL